MIGLAFGYGFDENVLSAYKFLVENWREGDRIFLFGFSRGAGTARVLAGFIHLIGLVRPEQLNLCDSAFGTYKRAASDNDLPQAWHFSRVVGASQPHIDFVGVWDTVGSVLVPRPDRLYIPSLETLPYTETNPSVAIFRHALALDERRRMFRGALGHRYPETESQLSKLPLIWMIEEVVKAGFKINKPNYRHLAFGEAHAEGKHGYVAPSATGPAHRSLKGIWWLLEVLPKAAKHREWKGTAIAGVYLPLAEPRRVDPWTIIDPSVWQRVDASIGYAPVNPPPRSMSGR